MPEIEAQKEGFEPKKFGNPNFCRIFWFFLSPRAISPGQKA